MPKKNQKLNVYGMFAPQIVKGIKSGNVIRDAKIKLPKGKAR